MEEIINHLYSDRNLTKLTEKLASLVDDFANTEEAKNYCKLWLKKKMKSTLDSSRGDMRGDKRDVIKKINTNCLRTALEEYKRRSKQNISQVKINRETEIYGKRRNKLEERPQVRQSNKDKDSLGTVADVGNFASFAPIEKNTGEYIRADGSMGDRMFFGNMNDQLQFGDKKSIASEIERRMLMRRGDYDGIGDNNGGNMMGMEGMMGNMSGNMMGMDGNMMNMGMMGYNPNIMGNNRKPPEINFSLDGSDTRGMGGQARNNMGMGMGNIAVEGFNGNIGGNGDFSSFGNFDMGNMNMNMNMNMNNMGGTNNMNNNMNMNMNMNNMGGNNNMANNNYSDGLTSRLSVMQQERNYDSVKHIPSFVSRRQPMQINQHNNQHNNRSNGLDAQVLLQMSSSDIDKQIKQNKPTIVPSRDRRDKQDSEDEDDDRREESKEDRRERLLQMIYKLKKDNNNKSTGLKKAVSTAIKKQKNKQNSDTETEQSETSEEVHVKKSKKKVRFVEKEDSSVSSEEVIVKKSKVNIDISPSEEDKEYYNDYMIDLKERDNKVYTKVSNIRMSIDNFNISTINDMSNIIEFTVDGQTKRIELEDGDYELDDLISGINDNLEELQIKCFLNKNKLIVFKHKDNFEIDCKNKKLGRMLGFTQNKYMDDNEYVAETINSFSIDKIYIYIPNIDKKPFATVDRENNVELLYKSSKVLNKLDSIIVRCKDINDDSEIYHEFSGVCPSIKLSFECEI